MAIDRYDWRADGDFPVELDELAGGTHIGFFLHWLVTRDHLGEEQMEDDDSRNDAVAVKNGEITGRDFLFKNCDGKLWEADVSKNVLSFVLWYYGEYVYFDDLGKHLSKYETIYHAEDSLENALIVSEIIDARYEQWKYARQGNAPDSSGAGDL